MEYLERRAVPTTSAVVTFGGNAQHTAIYQPAAQNLSTIHWQTPVDLAPQFSGSDLLIHYGAPLITSANTVLVPVKTGATGGFEVNAFNGATGAPKYSLTTDYILPSHNWTPSYSPTLAISSSGTRLYYAGAGGSVYYINNPDSSTPGTPVQQVFYSSLSAYQANSSAFNSTVFIDTPLTSDSNGDVFFGFRVQGSAPAPLNTTQSGYARIDPNGNATYVLAGAAAGDAQISLDAHNAAPALSNDGSTVYVLVKSASTDYYGYLLGLDSTTLATKYKVLLKDPRPGVGNAGILEDGTASPMVAPDNTVFIGVFAQNYDGSRGFTLHFSGDLSQEYLPAAFGWDDTDAIVPSSMVPQYIGTSPYLIFTKYNNYASTETGSTGGDGINQVAILDPYAAETDPRNDSDPTLQVMREVLTVPGPSPDVENISAATPEATREWCINTAAVDPALGAIFFPSEDGNLYEWCPDENTIMQAIPLGTGIGEAYVPTVIGPDGTVYSINDATLFGVGNAAGETVSIMSSAPSVQNLVAGQPITFTASVTNTSGSGFTPAGTITFEDGSTVLAIVPLDGAGNASYTTSSLPTNPSYRWATHFISAVYSGDGHFGSGKAMLNQTVHESATTTTLTSSTGIVSFGQPVTFTATVHPAISGLGSFTGVVTLEEGTTVLGQTPISSSGVATFTTSALAVGSHTITAAYYSDPVYAASAGNDSTSPVVVQSATKTSVSSSPNPSAFGQVVTVSALVTDGGSGGGVPTGTVTFTEGTDTLASAVPVDATGHASFTKSDLAVGSHTITAAFSGTAGWGGSSGSDSASPQVVNQDDTTTSLSSSSIPSVFAQSVTFTATVSVNSPGAGTPTGTVTFKDGSATLGTGTLSGGIATLSTSSLTLGSHSITASYSGDTNDAGSTSDAVTQAVNQDVTNTNLTSSTNPSVFGQNVTFTATVSVNNPGAGMPTGTVTFKDGSATLGMGTLSGGTATFSTSTLAVAGHSITASYGGDSNDAGSGSTAVSQTVKSAATVTTLSASANPATFGQSLTFTAKVVVNSPGAGVPTGSVTFKDGTTTLGTGDLSGGTATFSTSSLAAGSRSITAVYIASASFAGSTSASLNQTINKASTTTVINSSANPSVFGQSVTFTAAVVATAPGSGTPIGTVTFMHGNTTLGTGTLGVNGQATFTTSTLPVGDSQISASYSGSSNFSASASPVLTQAVSKDSTATALTSSSNPSVKGHSVTFTATVTASPPGGGVPSGNVTFMDGSKKLATLALDPTGQVSFATAKLTLGKHNITAVYKGDANDNASTSPALVQTVQSVAQAAARKRRAKLKAAGRSGSSKLHSPK